MRKLQGRAAPIAAMLLALAAAGCEFDFSNPVDPEASNYAGFRIIDEPDDIAAEKAWALPSDGSADPVFLVSRVVDATAYHLQVASAEDFSGGLLVDDDGSVSNEIAVPGLVSSLTDGNTYFWRACADKDGWGDWSPTASFVARRATGFSIGAYNGGGYPGATGSVQSYTLTPADATCPMIRWTSSDSSAVGVDARGKLRFITPGSVAVITGTTVDGAFAASFVASTLLSATEPTIVAGSDANGSVDGIGTAALFNVPDQACVSGRKLYVIDSENRDIREIDLETKAVRRIAGNPAQPAGSADGTGEAATFSRLEGGICSDGTNLYISDTHNHTIRKVEIATGATTTLAGTLGIAGDDDGIGANAEFSNPRGICLDGLDLYIAVDGGIRKMAIPTRQVTTLWRADFGLAIDGLCGDGESIYFSSSWSKVIYRLTLATGVVALIAGEIDASESRDGIGTQARLAEPTGICTDGDSLYVADSIPPGNSVDPYRYAIRKLDLATLAVGTITSDFQGWVSGIASDGSCLYSSHWARIESFPLN